MQANKVEMLNENADKQSKFSANKSFLFPRLYVQLAHLCLIMVEVSLEHFYHSNTKRTFTMVNGFFKVTGFSHLTMVNASLVYFVSFIIINFVYLGGILSWLLRSISWLCWIFVRPLYSCAFDLLHALSLTITCFRSPSRAIFDYHFSEILRLLKRSLPCRTTFLAILVFKLWQDKNHNRSYNRFTIYGAVTRN